MIRNLVRRKKMRFDSKIKRTEAQEERKKKETETRKTKKTFNTPKL